MDHHEHMALDFRRRFFVSLVLTVPVLVLSAGFWGLFGLGPPVVFAFSDYVVFVLATVIWGWAGLPFHTGLADELKARRPGMMTLVSVAITVAWAYSSATVFGLEGMDFFWELATLVDVMLLGHWIEMRSVMSAGRALESLVALMPTDAHRVTESGEVVDVEVAELASGDRVVVKPGERIPVDGVVREGRTSVDLSLVTGESEPVSMGPGDEVIGGAVNGEGSITVEVTGSGDDSYLARVVEMVRSAQESKSKGQDLADRAAAILTAVALSGGALTLAGWLALSDRPFGYALERAVTVMVIACPHALGLAIPLVVAVSTALAAGSGLLIRNRTPFEEARRITTVVFDKTGTLTEGRFEVRETVPLSDIPAEEVLRFAAAVEARSEHPIARAIADHVDSPPPATGFESIPGRGAQGVVDGRDVAVVSPGYLEEHGIDVDDERPAGLADSGMTVVYVLVDGEPAGAVALADAVRPESREAVSVLQERGIRCAMLTGDANRVAKRVAEELGLDDYLAEVLPDHKAERIADLKRDGRVAMVGDGVNDAPALATADLGIAIGAGTDVAIETADVVLVRSDPRDVADVFAMSEATYRKMIQNLAWATGYNAVALPLAAGVFAWAGLTISPAAGAVFMTLSTVIVAINARLLKGPSRDS